MAIFPFVPKEKRFISTSPVRVPFTGESNPHGLTGVTFKIVRGKLAILTLKRSPLRFPVAIIELF